MEESEQLRGIELINQNNDLSLVGEKSSATKEAFRKNLLEESQDENEDDTDGDTLELRDEIRIAIESSQKILDQLAEQRKVQESLLQKIELEERERWNFFVRSRKNQNFNKEELVKEGGVDLAKDVVPSYSVSGKNLIKANLKELEEIERRSSIGTSVETIVKSYGSDVEQVDERYNKVENIRKFKKDKTLEENVNRWISNLSSPDDLESYLNFLI
ncbi:hypothetical protein BY996DRAFT_6409937 [Phakopsora pachyrhizi]|uniref:Expressed protein n=1 Tax=Phakopsora pachyrhizi TaxID=170000 RepID=A0AAV0BRK5_PHAPC|nr:hypothetical protein BY996DRAFT_6409937 [Phakopsora pachyrhizi]CAH7689006.1 expressed protein [Phakopsora pachyrhizi]